MKEVYYSLEKIPDLSLNRYGLLEENGVEGVLKRHLEFLRQINCMGILAEISMHLFYQYDQSMTPGHRLKIMLMFCAQDTSLNYMDHILKASPLSEYFCFRKEESCTLTHNRFSVVSTITKREYFIKSSLGNMPGVAEEEFHFISKWKMKEDARLYNMFKLMCSLNQNCMYRVDIYPVDYSEQVKDRLDTILSNLKKRTEFNMGNTA